MIALHAQREARERTLRIIQNLRVLASTLFGIGALGLGVYCGLTIGGVVEMDWVIFIAVLLGLIIGNSFAWGYLDDWERREC